MPSLSDESTVAIIALAFAVPPALVAVGWLWTWIRHAFSASQPVQPDLELGHRRAEPVMNEAINDETVNDETVNDETVNNKTVNNDTVSNDAATLVSQPGTVLVKDFGLPSVEYSREGCHEPDINHDCIASVVLRPPSSRRSTN